MSSVVDQARARLETRLKAVRAERTVAQQQSADTCEHQWQRFRQTVVADNLKFQGHAHFIVKGCTKCHKKLVLDYIVEQA
jgi:hypothetical protein